jgi:phage terminase small subunit
MALTEKQSRFIDAYLLEPDGTKAAIAAGYSEKSAAVEANRLLKNAKVREALDEARKAIQGRTGVTADRVIAELAKVGFADIRNLVSWRANVVGMTEDENGEEVLAVTNQVALRDSKDLSDEAAASVSEISQTSTGAIKVKLHPKLPALVKLGEHLGLFRPEHAPRGVGKGKGKKEAALEQAQTAGQGGEWGDDLTGPMN